MGGRATDRHLAIILALAIPALAACGAGGSDGTVVGTPTPTPAPAPTPTPTPSPAPTPTPVSSAKATIRGLVAMGKGSLDPATPPTNNFEEAYAHPAVYSAVVVNLFWSQLEPARGTFDDSALNAALANVTAYNQRYPATPVVAKLRLFMGAGTPSWVIQATGGVTGMDDQGNSLTVGKFWTTTYQAYWRELQAHLAATYDASPLIAEIAVTSCSSLTGEPFILPQGKASITALQNAGFTDAAYLSCLTNAYGDYATWQRTPIDYTFNAYTAIGSGIAISSTDPTIAIMNAFRAALGIRAVVANHGLNVPLKAAAQPIYDNFQALYTQALAGTSPTLSPLEFQTLSPTVDWPSAIALGLTYYPTEIEVWTTVAAGGSAPLTQDQLASWASALKQ